MTLKGGMSQACAACKYQRRKCSSDCLLAPYFPAVEFRKFQNAHKLFGVSNIVKILKQIDPIQKKDAMDSIIYQANMREIFPVTGCQGIIQRLELQVQQAKEELYALCFQIDAYRNQLQPNQSEIASSSDHLNSPSHLHLGMGPPSSSTNSHTSLPLLCNDNPPQAYSSLNDSMWVQQQYYSCNKATNNGSNLGLMQSQFLAPELQQDTPQDYDVLHPFFDNIDDRQSYVDSKVACESSSEESLKDTTQSIKYVAENDLKNAAACFSLTSVIIN